MSEQLDQLISSYLDGVLTREEARDIEQRINTEPSVAARVDGMKRANSLVRDYFEAELNEPVPLALARAIEGSGADRHRVPVISGTDADNAGFRARYLATVRALAASLALVVGGAAGGYMAATWPRDALVAPSSWLADIADYHRVYAAEKRHLVEVAASDQEHLETWLTKVVGVPVRAPDLSAQGLTFEGGRLLVAAARPVAQLMYRRADGSVVALCMIRTQNSGDGTFVEATIGTTRLVSWNDQDAAYVVVGELNDSSLGSIAKAAAPLV